MPVRAILKDESDKNYSRAKRTLNKLESKVMYYEIPEKREWQKLRIITNPRIKDYGSIMEFEVNPTIWQVILNFSKGFRKFELKTAMEFESVYAMRFYELFSGQKSPITYSIEKLKIIFQLEDKYKLTANFINKVIVPAKKEMDINAPYSFEYEPLKTGRKITAIRFYPVYIAENRDDSLERKALQKRVSLGWDLDKATIIYLKQNYYFTDAEIKSNIDTFKDANKELDLMMVLSLLKRKAEAATNTKGYVIGTLKKMVKENKKVA